MASGQIMAIKGYSFPSTLAAQMDTRLGGSTPAELVDVFDFSTSTTEYLDFFAELRNYGGGGLTITIKWSATTATTGAVRWEAAIRRVAEDAEDIDAAHTYLYNFVLDTTASASGEVIYSDITFTDGADMDSWADGEIAIVRIRRNIGEAADDMAGDAELWWSITVKET